MIPILQISTLFKYGSFSIISGAINNKVPHLSYESFYSDYLLSPKSINLIFLVFSIKILSSLHKYYLVLYLYELYHFNEDIRLLLKVIL